MRAKPRKAFQSSRFRAWLGLAGIVVVSVLAACSESAGPLGPRPEARASRLPTAATAVPGTPSYARAEVIRDIPDVVVGLNLGSCGTFDILADWTASLSLTFHYDQDGNLVWLNSTYRTIGRSRYYNSSDPAIEVAGGPGEFQATRVDLVDGVARGSGPSYKVTLPGYGAIFFETGTFTVDLSTNAVTHNSGQNQLLEADFAALCRALTP
jgi:hypothetical protein